MLSIWAMAHLHLASTREATRASLVAQLVKNLPTVQETQVQSLGWATSLILAQLQAEAPQESSKEEEKETSPRSQYLSRQRRKPILSATC